MYSVSNLWKSLVSTDGHFFETRVRINGIFYGQDTLIEMTAQHINFPREQPSVGACLAGELSVKLLAPSAVIPRMALVEPFVRVSDGVQTSEWIPQGKFWIDTRETTNNKDGLPVLSLHCFDAMLKTEADYPGTSHSWPYSDINVVKEIAKTIGLQTSITATTGIDSRTIVLMNKGYRIGLPAGYSMREVLSNIGAMYGGNWVMTYDGKLLLITLGGIPVETNYLIGGAGEAITFGGDRILV